MITLGWQDAKIVSVSTNVPGEDDKKADGSPKAPSIKFNLEFGGGDRLIHDMYLSEGAKPYTEENLARLGYDPRADAYAKFESYCMTGEESPWAGKAVRANVVEEAWDGKTYQKVKSISVGGGSGGAPMSASSKEMLLARLRGGTVPSMTSNDDAPF